MAILVAAGVSAPKRVEHVVVNDSSVRHVHDGSLRVTTVAFLYR